MNQEQDNIRTMFDTTIHYLDDHQVVWNGMTAFGDAVARVRSGLVAIDKAADNQETPTKGVTEDKKTVRIDLEEQTLVIADQLAAFAAKGGNHDLEAQVQTNKSSLDGLQDSDLEQFAERVGVLATANIGALKDFRVEAPDVAALEVARQAFVAMKTSPAVKRSERKSQTLSLPELIANVRSIFRRELDRMATRFRKTDPDFYNGYFAARVIVNLAATHAAPAKPATP